MGSPDGAGRALGDAMTARLVAATVLLLTPFAARAIDVPGPAAPAMPPDFQTCTATLGAVRDQLAECTGVQAGVHAERDARCKQLDQLAQAALSGGPLPGDLGACVAGPRLEALAAQLRGEAALFDYARQLVEYNGGARDTVGAPPRAGSGALGDLLEELGPPARHERLLVEAVERLAPTFWRRLQETDGAATRRWLRASEGLDLALIREAAERTSGGSDVRAAVGAVELYIELARCDARPLSQVACARARQLQDLLESNVSLVIRRREQEVWETECASLGAPVLRAWLNAGPQAHSFASGRLAWSRMRGAITRKLYGCYLMDRGGAATTFPGWLELRAPARARLEAAAADRLDELREAAAAPPLSTCAAAVRALRRVGHASACEVPAELQGNDWARWVASPSPTQPLEPSLATCAALVNSLWLGRSASIPEHFDAIPTPEEMVHVDLSAGEQPMATLRRRCGERAGTLDRFPAALLALARMATAFGENVGEAPWRIKEDRPAEALRFEAAQGLGPWLAGIAGRTNPCMALGLGATRCDLCTDAADAPYDCALLGRLREAWRRGGDRALVALASVAVALGAGLWAYLVWDARRRHGPWRAQVAAMLRAMALEPVEETLAAYTPSSYRRVVAQLPATPRWHRWGRRALITRPAGEPRVTDRDINEAGVAARQARCELAVVVHPTAATLGLPALRASLDWASRGVDRAVQIVPVPLDRLQWCRSADDLLELAERGSSRGNPFEHRGHVMSSAQFYNRERLVSGMLASLEAGHWLLVTGLRRCGKSSLALEVARRIPAPSAYVDLSGFYHEIVSAQTPGHAADIILEQVCTSLHVSAHALPGMAGEALPVPPRREAGALDAHALRTWFTALSRALGRVPSCSGPAMVVFDELEHVVSTTHRDDLKIAVDLVSTLIGRLQAAAGAPPDVSSRPAVVATFCCALHPFMWMPLPTLGGQSLAGAFENVCVPRLEEEVGTGMMRSLAALQGIRFSDAAVAQLVREGHGVPLLLRRLGAAVLELYDTERARDGALGAVDVGIEAVRAAVRHEAQRGAPARGWIEVDLGAEASPAGHLLRLLASREEVPAGELEAAARDIVSQAWHGLLPVAPGGAADLANRVAAAAGALVSLLVQTGLVTPVGDLVEPHAYRLEEGLVRRVLGDRQESAAAS
jgi:hypothetical protein